MRLDDIEQESGLYLAAYFDDYTNGLIEKFVKNLGLELSEPSKSLHITIAYSRTPVDIEPEHTLDIEVTPIGYDIWDTGYGRTLVLIVKSDYLQNRFNVVIEAGGTYDFDEYIPHITLVRDIENTEINTDTLPLPSFDIVVVGEYSEPIDNDK